MATEVVSNREMVDSGRYEFVHGRLIERALPGLKHAALQQRMVDLLRPQVALTGKMVNSGRPCFDKPRLYYKSQ